MLLQAPAAAAFGRDRRRPLRAPAPAEAARAARRRPRRLRRQPAPSASAAPSAPPTPTASAAAPPRLRARSRRGRRWAPGSAAAQLGRQGSGRRAVRHARPDPRRPGRLRPAAPDRVDRTARTPATSAAAGPRQPRWLRMAPGGRRAPSSSVDGAATPATSLCRMGLGRHPYFALPERRRGQARLRLPAAARIGGRQLRRGAADRRRRLPLQGAPTTSTARTVGAGRTSTSTTASPIWPARGGRPSSSSSIRPRGPRPAGSARRPRRCRRCRSMRRRTSPSWWSNRSSTSPTPTARSGRPASTPAWRACAPGRGPDLRGRCTAFPAWEPLHSLMVSGAHPSWTRSRNSRSAPTGGRDRRLRRGPARRLLAGAAQDELMAEASLLTRPSRRTAGRPRSPPLARSLQSGVRDLDLGRRPCPPAGRRPAPPSRDGADDLNERLPFLSELPLPGPRLPLPRARAVVQQLAQLRRQAPVS